MAIIDSRDGALHPIPTGAAVVALAALPGILLSAFLTLIKFRADHHCDFTFKAVCGVDGCADVLSSDLAILFDLPLSAYASAYFLVALGLALTVLRRPRRGVAAPLLLVVGWLGLLAVLGLAAYAFIGLKSFCVYCAAIYGLTALVFLGASLVHSDGHLRGLRPLLSWRHLRSSTVLTAGLTFVALVVVQRVAYRLSAVNVGTRDICVQPLSVLPETDLVLNPEPPELAYEINLFIDLSCDHCREVYRYWSSYVQGAGAQTTRLKLYHVARDEECQAESAIGLPPTHHPCRAALAVECVETHTPGRGLEMVNRLFELQSDPEAADSYFTRENVNRAARDLGIEFPEGDAELEDHWFIQCLERGREGAHAQRIRGHGEAALREGFKGSPAAIVRFYDDPDAPLPRTLHVEGKKAQGDPELKLQNYEGQVRSRLQSESLATQPEPLP